MATTIYDKGLTDIIAGNVRLENDVIVALLTGAGYTPNTVTHEFVSDVSDEVTNAVGTGYERKVLTTKQFSMSSGDVIFTCDDLRWTGIQVNTDVKYVVTFRQGFDDNTSTLLFTYEIPLTQTVGADLLIEFPNGVALEVSK